VVAAGADGVAVVSAIVAAEDPTAATRALGEAVEAGRERAAQSEAER
jgi:thiamine-phosphate pyrophosphorylase